MAKVRRRRVAKAAMASLVVGTLTVAAPGRAGAVTAFAQEGSAEYRFTQGGQEVRCRIFFRLSLSENGEGSASTRVAPATPTGNEECVSDPNSTTNVGVEYRDDDGDLRRAQGLAHHGDFVDVSFNGVARDLRSFHVAIFPGCDEVEFCQAPTFTLPRSK
jgi:hypothetical protein